LCATCGWDNGYPNVRQAETEEEFLSGRLREAEARATQRQCLGQLNALREDVKKSVAVIVTNPNKAYALLNDPSELYTTFYRVVASGTRMPRPNWFDQVRGVADELLFPNYREYISFAALSLDGVGSSHYGNVHLVLADFAIRERATAFEENSLLFCEKHRLGVHEKIAPGHRSTWKQRDRLAVAKLEPKLSPTTQPEDFSGIVLSREEAFDGDFIEVHIYERLNRQSIQRVLVKTGGSEDDAIMKELIVRVCGRNDIACQEIP